MALISLLTAAWLVGRYVPTIMVAIIATLIGVNLVARARPVERRVILAARSDLNFNRRPTRAERRMVRKGLRLALDQTEFRSLFPATMTRAQAIADRLA